PRRAADAGSSRRQETLDVEGLLFTPQVEDGPRQPARQGSQRPFLAVTAFLLRQPRLGFGQLADHQADRLAEGPFQVSVADLAMGGRLLLASAFAAAADQPRVGEEAAIVFAAGDVVDIVVQDQSTTR